MKGVRRKINQEFPDSKRKHPCGKKKEEGRSEAKLAAKEQIEEGEPSYSSGKYNEADPLCQADYSSDDDNIPLARLLPDADSDTDPDSSDNAPLAQLLLK